MVVRFLEYEVRGWYSKVCRTEDSISIQYREWKNFVRYCDDSALRGSGRLGGRNAIERR